MPTHCSETQSAGTHCSRWSIRALMKDPTTTTWKNASRIDILSMANVQGSMIGLTLFETSAHRIAHLANTSEFRHNSNCFVMQNDLACTPAVLMEGTLCLSKPLAQENV